MSNIIIDCHITKRKDLYWLGIRTLIKDMGGREEILEQISIAREQGYMTDLQAFSLRELVYDVEREYRKKHHEKQRQG